MKLREYLDSEGLVYKAFAKKINISERVLHSIMNGINDPKLSTCLKIEKGTKGKVTCQELAQVQNQQLKE